MVDQEQGVERSAILRYVTDILTEITAEWDVGEISHESRLGDLGLESISLVYLIAEIQQHYHLQDLLFNRLRAAGIPIHDLCVTDVVGFIYEILLKRNVRPVRTKA
jgi:hypothetical protein